MRRHALSTRYFVGSNDAYSLSATINRGRIGSDCDFFDWERALRPLDKSDVLNKPFTRQADCCPKMRLLELFRAFQRQICDSAQTTYRKHRPDSVVRSRLARFSWPFSNCESRDIVPS